MNKLKILLVPLLMFSLLFTMACPAQSTIQKAINATEKIDSVTATAVETTKLAFNEGLLTFEQKDSLLPKIQVLAKGSTAFKNAANKLKSEYKNGQIPTDKLKLLGKMLEANVVAPFLEVLSDLKFIKNTAKILAVIGTIHVTLVSILQAFERYEVVAQLNQRVSEVNLPPFG